MTAFFADTSAIAKRYLIEAGSAWVRSWSRRSAGNVVVISELTSVEMFSLLARRQRQNTLSSKTATLLGNVFLLHAQKEYLTFPIDTPILAQARALVGRLP